MIPHGSADIAGRTCHADVTARPFVLTWGLIGPGKGIEWGIEAMSRLRDLRPGPRYVVAGQTHPEGARTRGRVLPGRPSTTGSTGSGLESSVQLDGRYRNNSDLAALVRSASVVLLPYDSTEQVTSGVLIEAVAAQRPVVATRFPHAVELLAGGAGILVPQRDPAAMADALRAVLTTRRPGRDHEQGRGVADRGTAVAGGRAAVPGSRRRPDPGGDRGVTDGADHAVTAQPFRSPEPADRLSRLVRARPARHSRDRSTATASTTWPGR